MSDTIKIRVWVSTNKVGSMCEDFLEVDRAEWEAMSETEKDEMAMDVRNNMTEWSYEEV